MSNGEVPAGLLGDAAGLYGVAAEQLTMLGAFESHVFSFHSSTGPAILKVIEPSHRTADQVQAEVDWLVSLMQAGIPVAAPLQSGSGNWVETVGDGAKVVVAFRRAPGEQLKPADWTDDRLAGWGTLLGRLQSHSRDYSPPGPRRLDLIESGYLHRLEELAPEADSFRRNTAQLRDWAAPLLVDGPAAGLVHADLHHGNLLLHQEQWTAIDFDDSGYGAWSFDLTMPLYYAVRALPDLKPEEAAARFLPPFLSGFRTHAAVPDGWADEASLFLQLRQAELALAIRARSLEVPLEDRLLELEQGLREQVSVGRPLLEAKAIRKLLG